MVWLSADCEMPSFAATFVKLRPDSMDLAAARLERAGFSRVPA
jgi:hypothetical protein